MIKPTEVFTITVHPHFYVHGCLEKQLLESRGLFGFHMYQTCPQCRVVPQGYEFWGENGHKQGGSPNDRTELAHRLRYLGQKQWRMKSGAIMGYRIRKGEPLYYVGS